MNIILNLKVLNGILSVSQHIPDFLPIMVTSQLIRLTVPAIFRTRWSWQMQLMTENDTFRDMEFISAKLDYCFRKYRSGGILFVINDSLPTGKNENDYTANVFSFSGRFYTFMANILAVMIQKNISLKSYNTFGLDYNALNLIALRTEEEAITFLKDKNSVKGPVQVVGGGSNILFTRDYNGTILHPLMTELAVERTGNNYVIVSAGAGINWDKFVEWCVEKGFGGIENLSNIPGMVGASPVQNIGAYGIEAKDAIEKVKAIKISDGSIVEFSNRECHFNYRDSIFKNEYKGMYLVTMVYFRLNTRPILNMSYGSLKREVMKIGNPSLRNIRLAVINIRRQKLPDPAMIGNAGSFFKNPVMDSAFVSKLKKEYPQIPCYSNPSGGIKLSAGWLIDQCGWKGRQVGNAGVYCMHSLVLVNLGNATGKELYDLSESIRESVHEKFGIMLEREVEVI